MVAGMTNGSLRGAVVPYFPSARWYASWLCARINGMPDNDAINAANQTTAASGKDFARCRIAGRDRHTLLSVAVEGGANRLRNPDAPAHAVISMHGNWPHTHLGAMEAIYGRTPYYQHIMPELRDILLTPTETLAELSSSLHKALSGFLPVPVREGHTTALADRCLEVASLINPGLSILDPLMRLGPETSLGLLALRN